MTALIIPAYMPDTKLLDLVKAFSTGEFAIVVVNDGSGAEYDNIFAQLPENVTVLSHERNFGKGHALKTAMQYILSDLPDCDIAVTVDADGQHSFKDTMNVVSVARENPNALVIGGRGFDKNVPLRSRFGNSVTRFVFSIASGVKVYDTQTGLRAFSRKLIKDFVEIKGERYEYEINMLLNAAQSGTPILEERIETIYLDDNKSSHFNTLRDSFRIYACILKFALSSFVSFGIDYLLFGLLYSILSQNTALQATNAFFHIANALLISQVGARVVSSSINFAINKRLVFNGNEKTLPALVKYFALAILVLCLDSALMHVFVTRWEMNEWLAKPLAAFILFFLNLIVQGQLVFRKKSRKAK